MRKEIKDLLDYSRYVISSNTDRVPLINMLIYYAQYLSLQDRYKPLVWCNFFNVNGVPYMSPFIAESNVDYSKITEEVEVEDIHILHFIQLALVDIVDMNKQFGIDGVKQFISGICDIQGRPSVDPYHMIYYVLKGKDKQDRIRAKKVMEEDESSRKYARVVKDDGGEEQKIECTKYVS